ncbi:MAG: HAD family phosphatase [Bacteroidales bacterium]|nr:HAD family phosphatase [Bacteroidales bacterium]MCF8328402.1 HAD family phosphatase [Bacteroidales bacterium]
MEIKNIIFDFGGVIYDIDFEKNKKAFQTLGVTETHLPFSEPSVKSIFDNLETGKLLPGQFYDQIRQITDINMSDNQIREAWNALLIGFVKERIHLLETIRNNYNIFLLSNSNFIHYQKYREEFEQQFGYKTFSDLFQNAYFSHEMGMQKPHPEIFETVMQEQMLVPGETLFIDDTKEHVESAKWLNINGRFLDISNKEELQNLFDQQGVLHERELNKSE